MVEKNVQVLNEIEGQPLGRILIVEDNLINAKVLLKIIEHLGYQGLSFSVLSEKLTTSILFN